MKKTSLFLCILTGLFIFASCNNDRYGGDTQVISYAADGLDLQAVGALLKSASDAEDFEKKLNEPNSVNNLDLDEDGTVDFIKVISDDQDEIRVLKLTAVLSQSGDEQDVATIQIEKTASDQASVQMRGNEQIYGHNHYYHSHFGIGNILLLSWLMGPRYGPYYSPFGRGSYPGYWGRGYSPDPVGTYRGRTGSMTRDSRLSRTNRNQLSRNVTPTTPKTSSKIKSPLRNPTASQRTFQARNPSSKIRQGGFGSRSTRSSSRGSRGRSSRFGK